MRAIVAALPFLLASCLALLASDASAPPEGVRPPDVGRAAWFLNLLKSLADNGLDDPTEVGKRLGVRFRVIVETKTPSFSEAFARSFEHDNYVPTSVTWFVPRTPNDTPAATPDPRVEDAAPAPVFHAVVRGNAVNLEYSQSKRFGLLEGNPLFAFNMVDDDREVSLVFTGVDKLACVTLKDMQARLPGLIHIDETDVSIERYAYYPKPREDAGSVLDFPVRGGECFTEVRVGDSSGLGNRERRAEYKLDACSRKVATAFCAGDPATNLQEFKAYEALSAALRERCGGLNAFYQREPRTDEGPPGEIDTANLPSACPFPGNRR